MPICHEAEILHKNLHLCRRSSLNPFHRLVVSTLSPIKTAELYQKVHDGKTYVAQIWLDSSMRKEPKTKHSVLITCFGMRSKSCSSVSVSVSTSARGRALEVTVL